MPHSVQTDSKTSCVCVCVCHERSDSDWECLSSRAPAGVLHLPIPSLQCWGRIKLGCQLRKGWAAAGAATNNLSLSLGGYKRLRWLSLQKQEHVQSDRGINHAASDVEQRHLGSGDTGTVSPEYKNTCSTETPDATFRGTVQTKMKILSSSTYRHATQIASCYIMQHIVAKKKDFWWKQMTVFGSSQLHLDFALDVKWDQTHSPYLM